jgi:hypothetical protein
MKRHIVTAMGVIALLTWILWFPSAGIAGSCTVSENYDRADSAGFQFNLHDGAGAVFGYITQLADKGGAWSVWIEGKGSLNEMFSTKEAAVVAACERLAGG